MQASQSKAACGREPGEWQQFGAAEKPPAYTANETVLEGLSVAGTEPGRSREILYGVQGNLEFVSERQVAAVSPIWVYRESPMKQLYDRRCGVRDWLRGARSAALAFDEINMSWHGPPEPNLLPWCGQTQRLVSPEPEFWKVFSDDCPDTTVTLHWSPPPNAPVPDRYTIWDTSRGKEVLDTVDSSQTSYTVTQLTAGDDYSFPVAAAWGQSTPM